MAQGATALERDDFIQIGMSLEQAGKRAIDDPRNACPRKAAAQRRQDGEGLHDVSESTRLDDADAASINLQQRRSGIGWLHRPAWSSLKGVDCLELEQPSSAPGPKRADDTAEWKLAKS